MRGQATTEWTELLMIDLDFSPLESLLELLEMLSQNAESLSGLSVLLMGLSVLLSVCCKTSMFRLLAFNIDCLFCRTLSAVMYCGSETD
jgi:hypothetical protein